jgi:branched-chain amino acid transport system ATP-binding protein
MAKGKGVFIKFSGLSPRYVSTPEDLHALGAAEMSLFEFDAVTLSFGGITAIRDLSFHVEKGEIFAIIGPNGAGKTSVLNEVSSVFDPIQGQIRLDGRDITRVPRKGVADLGIARTFQNLELFERASVIDNLRLGRHRFERGGTWQSLFNLPSHGRREDKAREAVEAIIDLLDLSPWREAMVGSLPYGVRKVVELGRALALEPRLLFLDEPASGVNPSLLEVLADFIRIMYAERPRVFLLVEHNMEFVMSLAQDIIVMHQGRVLERGSPAQVQASDKVVEAYLG